MMSEEVKEEIKLPDDAAENGKKTKTKKTKQKKVPVGIIAGITCAVLAVGGLGAGIGMGISLSRELIGQNEKQYEKVSRFIDDERERQAKEEEKESEYQEDGFKVAEQYEIRSTTHISDAYKNNDPSALSEEDRETYDMAKAILDEIIKDNMSVYEKEVAVYDWMYNNIGQGSGHVIALPGASSNSFTPHDVLKSRSAVCVGYATTFRMFVNMLGMDCHIVHNDYHSWDMVQLDDNEWYQLDIYSDVSGHTQYRNFNMTDEMARNGHDWDGSSLPEAKGYTYSYAVQNAKPIGGLMEVPAKIREMLSQPGSRGIYCKFPKKLSEEDLALADLMISQCQSAAYVLPELNGREITARWCAAEDDTYILEVYTMDYSGSSNMFDVDYDLAQRMIDTINLAFGSELINPVTPKENQQEGENQAVTETESKTDGASTEENTSETQTITGETSNPKSAGELENLDPEKNAAESESVEEATGVDSNETTEKIVD
ncbi:MAG: transglutaminase domain-containing protein [bacterium]|nr:transglutaminase domain-containing protein [bacterium]